MKQKRNKMIVVLHEIYGINHFIKGICENFIEAGFDALCPNLISRSPFLYEQSQEAYQYFMDQIRFEVYKKISEEVNQLKDTYEKVFIVGFSVGATLAWRCCENALCDGIVGCYGSRIRDYTHLNPACPTLLLFAKEASFDVDTLCSQLEGKPQLEHYQFEAGHGFIDPFSNCYDIQAAEYAKKLIYNFLLRHGS